MLTRYSQNLPSEKRERSDGHFGAAWGRPWDARRLAVQTLRIPRQSMEQLPGTCPCGMNPGAAATHRKSAPKMYLPKRYFLVDGAHFACAPPCKQPSICGRLGSLVVHCGDGACRRLRAAHLEQSASGHSRCAHFSLSDRSQNESFQLLELEIICLFTTSLNYNGPGRVQL